MEPLLDRLPDYPIPRFPDYPIPRFPDSSRFSHLKGDAADDAADDRRPTVLLGRRVADNPAYRGRVGRLHGAAQRVGEELFGHRTNELLLVIQQELAQTGRPLESRTSRHRAGRIDRCSRVDGAPPPDGIEVLE